MKTPDEWVIQKGKAAPFENRSVAIDFCAERNLGNVRLCLDFGEAQPDLLSEISEVEMRALLNFNRELRKKNRLLLRQIDLLRAESKELKKRFPFKTTNIGRDQEQTGDS